MASGLLDGLLGVTQQVEKHLGQLAGDADTTGRVTGGKKEFTGDPVFPKLGTAEAQGFIQIADHGEALLMLIRTLEIAEFLDGLGHMEDLRQGIGFKGVPF